MSTDLLPSFAIPRAVAIDVIIVGNPPLITPNRTELSERPNILGRSILIYTYIIDRNECIVTRDDPSPVRMGHLIY